jgi:hypothetical protein
VKVVRKGKNVSGMTESRKEFCALRIFIGDSFFLR